MEVFIFCLLFTFASLAEGSQNWENKIGDVSSETNMSSEGELVELLLTNYQKSGRPVLDVSKPVVVKVGVTLQQILKVDEKEQTITTNIWLNFAWKDEFLSWNASQAAGIDKLRVDVKDIWVPDIEPYNAVVQKGLREREQVLLESSGEINWIPPFILTTICKLDFTMYPFDRQTCEIKFGSWTYNGFKVDIQMHSEDGMDLSGYVMNREWALIGAPGNKNEVIYECCPEPYLDITYSLKLTRRRPASHIEKILVPSALLTFVGILSLLLPASQPSSRLLILLFTFLMICLGSTSIPHPFSLMATLLDSCTFTLLLLIVHTILVASLANSHSFYLACNPLWPQRWRSSSEEKEEEAFKARAQKISKWLDFAAFWVFLLCFGGYFAYSVSTV